MAMAYDWGLLVVDVVFTLCKTFLAVLEAIYRIVWPVEKNVAGEIVLVTGAGHGIGRETALKYAGLGATVVCWDINPQGNQETMSEMKRLGGIKAHAYECDVANRDEVFKTAARVRAEVGDVTILVNNAGLIVYKKFSDTTAEDIRKTIDVNVIGHFWMLQAFLPAMIEKDRGHVVAVSSMAGMIGIPNFVLYCATKFAVRGLMEAMMHELRTGEKKRSSNVKFTTICPYIVDTGHCIDAKVRFPSIMSMIPPEDAAQQIVSAQRRDYRQITIPGFWTYIINVSRLFSEQIYIPLYDFFLAGIDDIVVNEGGLTVYKPDCGPNQ